MEDKNKGTMLFPFSVATNTATIICCHIMAGEESIIFASHDEDDGMWQFICRKSHSADEARIVSLENVFKLDPSIGALADMPCGFCAERESKNEKWIIKKC